MHLGKTPRRPSQLVSSHELIEDFLDALKDVLACEVVLADLEMDLDKEIEAEGAKVDKARSAITKVCNLYYQLESRKENIEAPLKELSLHLKLDLTRLLADCLKFPAVIPYVRDLGGLRRLFICYCGLNEAPDREGLGLCTGCLQAALECVREKKKSDRFVLYRSYSSQVRCRHADFNTALVTIFKPGFWLPAWCEVCLMQEKDRISLKSK
jgi:hypothetical protein